MYCLFRVLILSLLALHCCKASNYDDDNYDDDSFFQAINVCEDSVIQVTSIRVVCDSPRTYYYGNGANRNSATCDYGDKATVTVNFTLAYQLGYGAEIYAVLAAYDYDGAELYQSNPNSLCDDYVGSTCTYQGSYSFTKQIQFEYLDGIYSNFVPKIVMAFSSSADGGSDLGGVNVNKCEADEDGGATYFDSWGSTEKEPKGAATFMKTWGVLLATVSFVSVFALAMWRQGRKSPEDLDDEDDHSFELM